MEHICQHLPYRFLTKEIIDILDIEKKILSNVTAKILKHCAQDYFMFPFITIPNEFDYLLVT